MVNSSKSTLKKTLVLGAAAIAATLLSWCDAMTASGTYDRDISYEFSSPRDKDAQTTLPSWVPENAKDIQMAQRTTGNERLLTFQSEAELPPSCLTLDSPGAPSPDQRVEGLAQESSKTNNELQSQVNSQHLEPLIETEWWPTDQEQKTTHVCGKWWVSQASSDTVYAFTPETRAVAEGVLLEREED